jgi:hypothetical protein
MVLKLASVPFASCSIWTTVSSPNVHHSFIPSTCSRKLASRHVPVHRYVIIPCILQRFRSRINVPALFAYHDHCKQSAFFLCRTRPVIICADATARLLHVDDAANTCSRILLHLQPMSASTRLLICASSQFFTQILWRCHLSLTLPLSQRCQSIAFRMIFMRNFRCAVEHDRARISPQPASVRSRHLSPHSINCNFPLRFSQVPSFSVSRFRTRPQMLRLRSLAIAFLVRASASLHFTRPAVVRRRW